MVQEVGNAVLLAISDALRQTAVFLPSLVAAIVIFLVGIIVAVVFKNVLSKSLEALGVDKALAGTGVSSALKRADANLTFSKLLGEILKWFVILVFLVPSIETLGLRQVSSLINNLILYLPNVIYAAIIITVGAVFAKFGRNFVLAAVHSMGAHLAELAAAITKWAIWIFSILAALSQLGIAQDLIRILFFGLVAMLALAGGLAFGLGGQEAARDLIKGIKEEVKEKK